MHGGAALAYNARFLNDPWTFSLASEDSQTPPDETFGDEALDALLEEGVLKGFARMDVALAVAAVFIVLMWGFFTYFHVPNLPFLHEDFERIVENPAVHNLSTMSEGWNSRTIRPLTALSYALDWQLGNGTPGIFHFTSALIHALNAAMLFLLCRRLFVPERASDVVCLAPALLFLVHPSFSAPALYVSNQAILFGTLFALRATLFYVGTRTAAVDDPPYNLSLSLAMASFVFAWAAHTAVWALPILLIAADKAVFGRVRWRRLAPMALLAAVFLVVHITTRRAMDDAIPAFAGLWQHAGTFGDFVEKTVDLTLPVLEHPERDRSMVGFALWLAVFIAGLLTIRFRLGLALLWTSVFFISQGLLFTPMRTTDAYLAFAGSMLAVPLILGRVQAGTARAATGIAAAVVIVTLSATTFLHSFAWEDEEALLLETIEACPECDALYDRLSRVYVERGRRSMDALRQSMSPDDLEWHREAVRESYSAAIPLLEVVLERDPRNAVRWLQLGEAKAALGDGPAAVRAYENATAADPWSGEAAVRLAESLLAAAGGAPSHAERMRIVDLFIVAHQAGALGENQFAQFARVLTELGNFEAADEILRAGIDQTGSAALRRLQERNAQSLESLSRRQQRIASLTGRDRTYEQAELLHLRRKFLESSYTLEADLNEHGFDERMWLLLGRNKAEMNQLHRFIEEYRGRADVPPESWAALAQRFADDGNTQAAEAIVNAIPPQN